MTKFHKLLFALIWSYLFSSLVLCRSDFTVSEVEKTAITYSNAFIPQQNSNKLVPPNISLTSESTSNYPILNTTAQGWTRKCNTSAITNSLEVFKRSPNHRRKSAKKKHRKKHGKKSRKKSHPAKSRSKNSRRIPNRRSSTKKKVWPVIITILMRLAPILRTAYKVAKIAYKAYNIVKKFKIPQLIAKSWKLKNTLKKYADMLRKNTTLRKKIWKVLKKAADHAEDIESVKDMIDDVISGNKDVDISDLNGNMDYEIEGIDEDESQTQPSKRSLDHHLSQNLNEVISTSFSTESIARFISWLCGNEDMKDMKSNISTLMKQIPLI